MVIAVLLDVAIRIPKVRITFEKLEGTCKKSFTSKNDGRFRSPLLAIGHFEVTIFKEGIVTKVHTLKNFDDKDPLVEIFLAETAA